RLRPTEPTSAGNWNSRGISPSSSLPWPINQSSSSNRATSPHVEKYAPARSPKYEAAPIPLHGDRVNTDPVRDFIKSRAKPQERGVKKDGYQDTYKGDFRR